MIFPHPDDVHEFVTVHGINMADAVLLERVSRRALERSLVAEFEPEKVRPLGPVDEAEFQAAEAIWFHAGYVLPVFEWPYRAVDDMVGAVLPGEITVVAAQTGNGKSQLIANLLSRIARRSRERLTLAALERKPREIRGLWACIDLGIEPRLAFKRLWHLVPDQDARAKALEHFANQVRQPLRDAIAFTPESSLDRRGLEAVLRRAHSLGHRLVVIDHIHHMDHGDGPENRGIRETMKLAKRVAQELEIAVLFTAQLNRGQKGDALQRYFPPDITDVQGSSAIEQVADVVLLAYRPLRHGITRKDIDAVRMGQADRDSIFLPNTMAVRCGKHRLDGSKIGKDALLHIHAGVISDRAVLPSGTPVADPDDDRTSMPAYAPVPVRGDAYEETR